ncbi:Holliday junction resolvase RuvX [Helicovermis profundi]|uniref:Putative pre-16S rRNA nuclease n=1 Tax=Helicovermis profundi TaxID=3065157 RepID=A0AAU9E2X7_9FIRM|nr:Holliday junction resolvase RuvX [Clostridia bacterium S502]
MKILGLDVGDSTIGVAITDDLLITAQGRETIFRESLKIDIDKLIEYIITENVNIIVVGLPKNMNGTIGMQGEKTISFVKKLEKKIKFSIRTKDKDVKIEYWDERLTSKAAEKTLINANVRRDKRKKVIDKLAAVYILQGFVDNYNMVNKNNM